MDGNGALFGTLCGNTRDVLHKFTVDLPKKHGKILKYLILIDKLYIVCFSHTHFGCSKFLFVIKLLPVCQKYCHKASIFKRCILIWAVIESWKICFLL